MKRYHILYIAAIAIASVFSSCVKDDEDNTPSNADTDRMEELVDNSIPDIVNFKNQYGTYLLYDFDFTRDFAYQFEESTAWSSTKLTLLDKNDVKDAVAFLMNSVFCSYSDSYKTKYLPRKILMVSKIIKASKLGLSSPQVGGVHQAVANMNSITIGELNEDDRLYILEDVTDSTNYVRNIHYAIIGAYLVNARGEYIVSDDYFDYSSTYYNSLMDSNRTMAGQLSDEFFFKKGFFRPDANDDTYFESSQADIVQFVKNAIMMDSKTNAKIQKYEIMTKKMSIVINSMKSIGINIDQINPYAAQYVK